MVGGVNKQRGTIPKVEATSPTAATESVLLTAIIDAMENCDVATVDIPNAYIQTRLTSDEDKAIMCIRGKLAEPLVKVAPEIYSKDIIANKKRWNHALRILNDLYGIMKGALLFY